MNTAAKTPLQPLSGPLRVLPVLEQWDCHSCGICCKAHTVILDADDLERLRSQNWEQHPEFRNTKIVRRIGLLRPEYVLAQRADGSCIFLTEDGLCTIHKEHGEPEKPWACRMFPFQVLPTANGNQLTMRRNCPSAAANKGRPLRQHIDYVRSLAAKVFPEKGKIAPPRIVPGAPTNWADSKRVTDALQRMMLAELPIVRRLIHGLEFCESLAGANPHALSGTKLRDAIRIFEEDAMSSGGKWFKDRIAPDGPASVLFRQSAAEYMRFHPNLGDRPGMRERVRLFWAGIRMARGKGQVPKIHPDLPPARFDDLEQPLGPLPPEVMQPIQSYFESMAASTQYCGAGRAGWSVVDGFRALALAYPVAMYALRWFSAGRTPTVADAVNVVCLVDRSHYYPLLSGSRHRRRLHLLAKIQQLPRVVVWYAR